MPHVEFVPLSGFRVREEELLALGMTLPGFAARGRAIAALPALGVLTLAGMLPGHWTAGYRAAARVDDELVAGIVAARPDLVAISCLTASAVEAYALAGRLRAHRVPTVIGGLHATALPAEAARHCDAVVVGDGEAVWPRLLADLERGDLRPCYDAGDGHSLAAAPLPRFDLLGPSPRPRYTIQTQRGCPLACEFCAASRLLGAHREKPAARIAAELDALLAGQPRASVELADDNSFVAPGRAGVLADLFAGRGIRWFTESDWRIGERPTDLRRLADAGLVQVLVGIESLSFRHPGMGAKRVEPGRILDAVTAIQEAGIVVNGCFIVGADGETDATLDALVEFLLASPFAEVQVTLETPFPGTPLHARLARAGRLIDARDWSYYTLFDVVHRPDLMTVAGLEAGFRRVLAAVFGPGPSAARGERRRRVWANHPAFRGRPEVPPDIVEDRA